MLDPNNRDSGGGRSSDSRGGHRSLGVVLSWLGLAVGLWALSAASLALYLPFHHSLAGKLLLAASLLTAICGTSILVVQAIWAWRFASERVESGRAFEYKQRVGDPLYLDQVASWGQREIGDAHPDAERIG